MKYFILTFKLFLGLELKDDGIILVADMHATKYSRA